MTKKGENGVITHFCDVCGKPLYEEKLKKYTELFGRKIPVYNQKSLSQGYMIYSYGEFCSDECKKRR